MYKIIVLDFLNNFLSCYYFLILFFLMHINHKDYNGPHFINLLYNSFAIYIILFSIF